MVNSNYSNYKYNRKHFNGGTECLAINPNHSTPSTGHGYLVSLTKAVSPHPYSLIKVRQFSTDAKAKDASSSKDIMSDHDFNEWLRGFADGEGCFQISMRKDRVSTFRFVFKIKLHKDDRPLLEYLSSKFNIGKVYPKDISIETISSTWEINTRADLLRLIEILDKHPP